MKDVITLQKKFLGLVDNNNSRFEPLREFTKLLNDKFEDRVDFLYNDNLIYIEGEVIGRKNDIIVVDIILNQLEMFKIQRWIDNIIVEFYTAEEVSDVINIIENILKIS